jgi:transcription elongation GreA/GreB family factor
MTPQIKGKLVVLKEDYDVLMSYAGKSKTGPQKVYASELLESLGNAEVVSTDEFPGDMIRLNSKVTIRDKVARYNYVYTIVLPEEADHRKGKVSVLAPIGAALLGYRTGEDVIWQMHSGKRYFTIMAVTHLF